MAKDKNKEVISKDQGVYVQDGKYHCADCDAELDVEHVCPTCHKQVDWDRLWQEVRSRGGG